MKALREANANVGIEVLTALEYAQLGSTNATTLYIISETTGSSDIVISGAYVGSIAQDALVDNDGVIVWAGNNVTSAVADFTAVVPLYTLL